MGKSTWLWGEKEDLPARTEARAALPWDSLLCRERANSFMV